VTSGVHVLPVHTHRIYMLMLCTYEVAASRAVLKLAVTTTFCRLEQLTMCIAGVHHMVRHC
jgi:hypothetical protein